MRHPRVVIHAEPRIAWQATLLPIVVTGLRASGVPWAVTRSRDRTGIGLPVLLGTTCFRAVEADGPYLLVDRCSFGDPGRWLSIVRCGHGRRGDHRVPPVRDGSRWRRGDDYRRAVTLNSSVAVSTVLAGIPTVTMDEGAMAWDVTSHDPGVIVTPDRTEWLHWLAWTQWSYDEIREGVPWPRFL